MIKAYNNRSLVYNRELIKDTSYKCLQMLTCPPLQSLILLLLGIEIVSNSHLTNNYIFNGVISVRSATWALNPVH